MRTCEQREPRRAAAPGRAGHLLHQAARRGRPHGLAGGGDGRAGHAGTGLSAWATRPTASTGRSARPSRCSPHRPRPTPWRNASSPRWTPSRKGLAAVARRGRRLPHPGLHLRPGRGPGARRRRAGPGRAHGAPCRRLHDPGAGRLPAPGHPRAGPAGGGERGLAAPAPRRLRRGRPGHPQRGRRGPLRGRSHPDAGRPSAVRRGSPNGSCSWPSEASNRARAAASWSRPWPPCRGSSTRRRRSSWSGGHSFQDYTAYRDDVLALLPRLGLEIGRDVQILGTVTDAELHAWYRSADALAFPSVREGWGLAVLEAMTADLPVVASDIAVLREYLTDRETAVLTRTGDPASLAAGMRAVVTDERLRADLVAGGRALVPRVQLGAGGPGTCRVLRRDLNAPAGPGARPGQGSSSWGCRWSWPAGRWASASARSSRVPRGSRPRSTASASRASSQHS